MWSAGTVALHTDLFVVLHLLNVVDERLDVAKELGELVAAAETLHVALHGVPLNAQDEPVGFFDASGHFVGTAVGRTRQRDCGGGVCLDESFRVVGGDAVADVLDGHGRFPSLCVNVVPCLILVLRTSW